ncbi:MAG TPA: DUF1631 domain-containing protein [Rhodanobacteraceae bacterium]|jgi:pyruvate/2-oxoglutarate dehydrogenase complex dihydrolipoamide acyltransferase (E2) component|nr:DUF1631 domain-containing protein [Rhodanobacteraceae bacterium]
MKSLKQRPDLPSRVRSLLEGLLERSANQFEHAISRTLDEFEQELFKLAERSRSNDQQHARFEALREIKRARADIAPRFLLHVESTLAQISATAGKSSDAKRASAQNAALELIDSEVLEEDLALQEIVSKSEIRHSQALYALSHRFGVLAGSPAWDPEVVPLGPAQLARALRHATRCLDLGVEYRVLSYRLFDRVAMLPIGEFYDVVNSYLAKQRILAHLQSPNVRAHGTPAGAAAAADAPTDDAAKAAEEAAASASAAARQPPPAPAEPAAGQFDSELFSTLRMLLSGRRHAQGGSVPFAENGYLVTRDDLQSVLGSLQSRSDLAHGRSGKPRDAAALRQDMLMHLKEMSPQGRAAVLAEEDSDTVDLVGMLFDYINKGVKVESSAQALLTRLQVPVLRVALSDKTFFTQREHPARMLLNTIAETGSRWMDDEDADPSLAEKMQVVVDKVSSEFNGDVTLFRSLLTDLGSHMQLLARRAEVAERRHVDAAKGREKLDMARDTARTAIERLIKRGNPTPLVRALLEQAWTDALALTILRQGADSSAFHRRLAVADQLLRREPTADTPADRMLQKELDVGLSQVGLHGDDVRAVLGRLFPAGQAANDADKSKPANDSIKGKAANDSAAVADDATSATALALKLKSRARLGGEQTEPARPTARTTSNLTPEETQILERLRTLPFGTWFEFTTNQQGATVRRKLAWFSTLTGRALFVNQRGARTDEKTLDQLARDIARKQAKIWTDQQESLIDRAWKAIVGTLKQFSGGETQGATA